MNVFQWVLVIVFATLLLASGRATLRGTIHRAQGVLWSLLWLVAIMASIYPNLTSRVARQVGIDRGASLVLYCVAVAGMVGFWMIYIRLRRVRREVTLLVRHIALLEADREIGGGAQSGAAALHGKLGGARPAKADE